MHALNEIAASLKRIAQQYGTDVRIMISTSDKGAGLKIAGSSDKYRRLSEAITKELEEWRNSGERGGICAFQKTEHITKFS